MNDIIDPELRKAGLHLHKPQTKEDIPIDFYAPFQLLFVLPATHLPIMDNPDESK